MDGLNWEMEWQMANMEKNNRITHSEQQKENRLKKYISKSNMYVILVLKGEEKEGRAIKILKEIVAKN